MGNISDTEALEAAKVIQQYCIEHGKVDAYCKGCIFNIHKCILNDLDHLPETWELNKVIMEDQMSEWIKAEEQLPKKKTWVEVKTEEVFPNTIGHAVLIDTEWGTTEWLYSGIIHMAIDMVKEWRYADVK